jgi:hypothetical protein
MLKPRRRVALGITATAAAVSMIALATPAQAISPPLWPTAGRIPTGCSSLSLGISGGDWQYGVTDATDATLVDITINSGSYVVAPPAGVATQLRFHVRETCSGVLGLSVGVKLNGVAVVQAAIPNAPANVFDGWWTTNTSNIQPDSAGYYTFPFAQAYHRWDTFVLDGTYHLVSAVDNVPGTDEGLQFGPWSTKNLYILRAASLTPAAPAKAKKGKTVKATAVLKYASNTGYVVDAADKVIVQTKVGAGKWVSNATLTTNASGVVSYSFVLAATTQVRFVHNRVLSGKFTNAVTSAIKTVTRA